MSMNMSMGRAMAEECSTHRYLMSPSHPLQGIFPYCLTQRICFLKIQRKQVSSFSFYKKRRSNNSKSFFLSLFSKLHCGRNSIVRTNFSATFPSKPNFSTKIPVIRQALTTSGVHRLMEFLRRSKEHATWKELHPTALRPLAPHQGSGIEADGDNTSDGELFYSGQSSPSPSSGMTRSKETTRST
ncbi:hypothetical protein AMTRI_Chr12g238120 [Amborella trichopoda]